MEPRNNNSDTDSGMSVNGWHALSLRRAWGASPITPFEDSGRATQLATGPDGTAGGNRGYALLALVEFCLVEQDSHPAGRMGILPHKAGPDGITRGNRSDVSARG
jgi:hypothetical protein